MKSLWKRKQRKSLLYKREEVKAYLFLMPSLLGVSIFLLLPFCDVVRRSFMDAMGKKFVGMKNYQIVIANEAFSLAANNTIRFVAICIPLLLLLSLLLSLLICHQKKGKEFFKTTFLIPMAIPVAAVVLLWKIVFHSKGLLNTLLFTFSGEKIDWMNTDYAFGVLVFSYLWKNIGYDMVLWLAGLSMIPISLYEAASLDGAGKFSLFRHITLPMLLPTVFIVCVLSLVNSFKVFREAYLIAGNYPNKSIYLIQHLFNNWFVNLEVHKMCAAAVILAGLIAVVLFLVSYVTKRGGEK